MPVYRRTQNNTAEWATSDQDNGLLWWGSTWTKRTRCGQTPKARSDWLRRGRLFGALGQSQQGYLNKGLRKRCAEVVRTICLPFIDHTRSARSLTHVTSWEFLMSRPSLQKYSELQPRLKEKENVHGLISVDFDEVHQHKPRCRSRL